MKWGLVVAAGGSVSPEMAEVIGAPTKSLAQIAGRTSVEWVLEAARGAGLEACAVVGAPDLKAVLTWGEWIEETGSAIDNVQAGADALGGRVDAILSLPSDAPLVTPEGLRHFMRSVETRLNSSPERPECWFAAGLCEASNFRQKFPEMECIPLKIKGAEPLAGGLYAVSPAGLKQAHDVLQQIRHSRKSQLQMASRLGLWNLVKYFTRQLDFGKAEDLLKKFLGGPSMIISDCEPESVVDFDSPAEFVLVREACEKRLING